MKTLQVKSKIRKETSLIRLSPALFLFCVLLLGSCSRGDQTGEVIAPSDTQRNGDATQEKTNGEKGVTETQDTNGVMDSDTLTPGDQSEEAADRAITQKIRQSLMRDDALSMTAKNVKVITVNGVTTLRGPVKSETEKALIESKAKQVAGVTRVDNQLEVIEDK